MSTVVSSVKISQPDILKRVCKTLTDMITTHKALVCEISFTHVWTWILQVMQSCQRSLWGRSEKKLFSVINTWMQHLCLSEMSSATDHRTLMRPRELKVRACFISSLHPPGESRREGRCWQMWLNIRQNLNTFVPVPSRRRSSSALVSKDNFCDWTLLTTFVLVFMTEMKNCASQFQSWSQISKLRPTNLSVGSDVHCQYEVSIGQNWLLLIKSPANHCLGQHSIGHL